MKGKLWMKYYRIRPHVIYAGVNFLWLLGLIPNIVGGFLCGRGLVLWSLPIFILGLALCIFGFVVLAPMDDYVRKYRHNWKHRNWQGDPPEWRP